jgi:cell division protein FtsW (lipid II flippase)
MLKKFLYVLEITWLIVAIFSFMFAAYRTHYFGIKESYPLYIIFVISVVMYFYRRKIRQANKN